MKASLVKYKKYKLLLCVAILVLVASRSVTEAA